MLIYYTSKNAISLELLMPLFTRCNIGLSCPQNMSEVSAQNTPQIIYYTML